MISKTKQTECNSNIMAMKDTLDILGGKWTLLITYYLIVNENEINTFSKLEKNITGISARMLSNNLKILETNLIVDRKELNTKPVSVQYTITDYGKETAQIVYMLVDWGRKHRIKLFPPK